MPTPTFIPNPPSPPSSVQRAAILAAACEIHEHIYRTVRNTDPALLDDVGWSRVLISLWSWVRTKTGTTLERTRELGFISSARAKTPPPEDVDLRMITAIATLLR